MENREAIYNYLQTLPKETTVGELVDSFDRANDEFEKAQEKQIQKIKDEYVGNVYYYEEKDSDEVVCTYMTLVNDFCKKSFSEFTFVCDVIATSSSEIHYETRVYVDARALKEATKTDKKWFDDAVNKFNEIRGIRP